MSAFSHNLAQVTYPRMERQDLTQAQLGSFKFTPTDEVRYAHPANAHIQARKSRSLYPSNIRDGQSTLLPPAASNLILSETTLTPVQPTRPPTFFDKFVKPDLDRFRLRSGPTALRAAVDSIPVSPSRQISPPRTARPHLLRPENHQPNMSLSTNYYSFDDSRTAPVPLPPTFDCDLTPHSVQLLLGSLARALASEQQAHEATKTELQRERIGKAKVDEEVLRYIEYNRSLSASVGMLQDYIQHSKKNKEEEVRKADITDYEGEKIRQAGRRYTILHDTVKNSKEPPLTDPKPVVNLFDFDLLEKQAPHLTACVSASNTPVSTALPEIPSNRLINISESELEVNEESKQNTKDDHVGAADVSDTSAVKKVFEEPKNTWQDSPKFMAMPFDAHIQWSQCQVFDDPNDKLRRLGNLSTVFAENPVRYIPKKSDKNIYRTTMIDFIPLSTTVKEVLGVVRGGTLESIELFGPIGRSTTFLTARVVFVNELGAREVYMRGQSRGIFIRNQRIRVWQVLEATYPRDRTLDRDITKDGFTRVLLIDPAVVAALATLPQKLSRQIQSGTVVEIGQSHDGIPMVEFTSVAECGKALRQLMDDKEFGGSRFDFEQDPCAIPYDCGKG